MHEQSWCMEGKCVHMTLETVKNLPEPEAEKELSRFHKISRKWVDHINRRFKKRVIRLHGNKKCPNLIDPYYGCPMLVPCPWGCYAEFTCKKHPVDFFVPVKQVLDVGVLRDDLRRLRNRNLRKENKKDQFWFIRIGGMGEPGLDWDFLIEVCEVICEMGFIPVVFTRIQVVPSHEQLLRMAEMGVMIHNTICTMDEDSYLEEREESGGVWVWRVVTMYFDEDTDEGLRLWEKQDHLMSGEFGNDTTLESKPLILENPARVMKGKRAGNPNWHLLAEWAYSNLSKISAKISIATI